MADGDLTAVANALPWLGLTEDDGTVADMISAVSTEIQNFIGYRIATAAYTRTFNGTGGSMLLLPDRPVTAVSGVSINGIPVPAAAMPNDGFVFDTKFLYLTTTSRWGFRFFRGFQNVTVSYTAGYATVPADIAQACLTWIASQHAMLAVGGNAALKLMKAGDTAMEFGNTTTTLGDGQVLLMPPTVAAMLQPYQRIAA